MERKPRAIWSGVLTALAWLLAPHIVGAQVPSLDSNIDYRIRPQFELGGLAVLSHHVTFGRQGTDFNYVRDGGQDNLFFLWRLSVDVELAQRHTVVLLYQPLQLDTRAQLARVLVLDEARFEPGTPMTFKYGFPFYRVSYLYHLTHHERYELGVGASVQLRNATIEFASLDGQQLKSYRNIGIVPLLKLRGHYTLDSGVFFGAEVDGIYAPIPGANGSDNKVTGALLDASVRVGVEVRNLTRLFFSLRYLGGGATGQSTPEPFSDGRTKNWLHAMTVSIGGSVAAP